MMGHRAARNPKLPGTGSLLNIMTEPCLEKGLLGAELTYATRTRCQRSTLNTGPGVAHMELFRISAEP